MSLFYSAFHIDKPHRHNQNPVGANRDSPLQMKTVVNQNPIMIQICQLQI